MARKKKARKPRPFFHRALPQQKSVDVIPSSDSSPLGPLRASGVARVEQFSGPIPHPKTLRQYDELLPGSADRIIAMAEKEQTHRHRIERRDQTGLYFLSAFGQLSALLLAALGIVGAFLLLYYDKKVAGYVTLFGTATVFVGGYALAKKIERQIAADGAAIGEKKPNSSPPVQAETEDEEPVPIPEKTEV